MVNMHIPYRRSCYSLITLQNEIRQTFPGREQNKGFVTGYKSAANFTGHNADRNGITFAYDIGVDCEHDGTGLKPADAEWLANYLRLECNPRFAYLIYNRRIASNATGFKWVPYTGSSPHVDHIHISVADLYWGESSGVSAAVYDSRKSWGVYDAYHGNKAQGPTVLPAQDDKQKLEWSDMATEKEIRNVIRDELRRFVGDVVDVPGNQPTGKGNDQWTIPNAITSVWGDVGAIRKAVANLPDAILDAPVKLEGSTNGTTTLRKKIAWQAHEFHRNTEAVEALTDALDEPEGHPDEPYGA